MAKIPRKIKDSGNIKERRRSDTSHTLPTPMPMVRINVILFFCFVPTDIGGIYSHLICRSDGGCVASKTNPPYGLGSNRTLSILVTYEQGVIKVFDDHDQTPFMTYTDPHPLTIRHVAICKYNTEGRFVIHICDSY